MDDFENCMETFLKVLVSLEYKLSQTGNVVYLTAFHWMIIWFGLLPTNIVQFWRQNSTDTYIQIYYKQTPYLNQCQLSQQLFQTNANTAWERVDSSKAIGEKFVSVFKRLYLYQLIFCKTPEISESISILLLSVLH